MATKTRNTLNIENTIAAHLALCAAEHANADIAAMAHDASFAAFASATLVLGAKGYATLGETPVHTNVFGSEKGSWLALQYDIDNGKGEARKLVNGGNDDATSEMSLEDINAAIDAADVRITAELAEMTGANCQTCADFAAKGRSFKCRTHAR